ncbi:30S ribosomal protein S3 [Candidatus Woesearchaeota archaeon]|nr:30S ribosomal protein S3 [Candidatus Woesearchaeota archaeon]
MMERGFIAQKNKELQIKKYLETKLSNVGLSEITLKKIPLGEKIIIKTSRPSLVVGSKGANIKDLTRYLKKEFNLENPQVEIIEIKNIFLDANVVAEKIANSLERFGSARFKGVGHKTMENVIDAGALGVEIIISGKIPGSRAKSWRFYQGYLKKCGDISLTGVNKAKKVAALKSGIVGIKVSIMPPDIKLPDKITILKEPLEVIEEVKEEKKKVKKRTTKKKPAKKKVRGSKASGTPEAKPLSVAPKEEKKPVEEPVKEPQEAPKEKPAEDKKEEQSKETENIPSAEKLIKETIEKFEPEESKVSDPKKLTAEEIIEKAKGDQQ